jgi:hypothetical protein
MAQDVQQQTHLEPRTADVGTNRSHDAGGKNLPLISSSSDSSPITVSRIGRNTPVAFFLMAIVSACTAACAYLMGTVVNEAYINRNFRRHCLARRG